MILQKNTWLIWPLWAIAAIIGFILGNFSGTPAFAFVPYIQWGLLATIQWGVWRLYAYPMRYWIPITLFGVFLGEMIKYIPGYFYFRELGPMFPFSLSLISNFYSFLIVSAIKGSLIGFSQWLLLRNSFYRTGWWVLANAFGFAAAKLVIWMLLLDGRSYVDLTSGLMFGVITGALLLLIVMNEKDIS